MAGVLLRSSFTGQAGTEWRLDIYDTDHSGLVSTFSINGFNLERSEPLSNRVSPVLGSEVTVNMIVNSTATESFINTATTADEDRFFLNLYKDGVLDWSGVLLLDLIDLQDLAKEANRQVAIRFTDGIARLKNIKYNNSVVSYVRNPTIIEHINNILGKIPTQQFWSGSEIHLKTSCHYFDTAMTYSTSTDPLEFIRVNHKAFYEIKKNGDVEYMNCYDVLVQLMSNFYQRFWLGDGSFNAVQVDEFRNSSVKLFHYTNGGTSHTATSTISPRLSVDQSQTGVSRLRGGTFNRYAGLKAVNCIYIHNTSGNFAPEPIILNASAVTLGEVDDNGGDARMNIKGVINLTVGLITTTFIKIKVRLKIKQGSKYLKRTATTANDNNNFSDAEWTNTSTDTVEFWTTQITSLNWEEGSNITINRSIEVDFATPYLLNDGDLEVELISLTSADVYALRGNLVTTGVTLNGNFNAYIEYKTDEGAENKRKFEADNSALGNYSQVLDLPDAVFGEAINSATVNKLEVYNGSSWVTATGWKKKNAGISKTFHTLLCEDVLSGQRTAIVKYRGNIRGVVSFMNTLTFSNGDVFGLLGGSFNGKTEIWEGLELFKIGYDSASITNTATGEPIAVDLPPSLTTTGGNGVILDSTVEIVGGNANIIDNNNNVSVGPAIGGDNNVNVGGNVPTSATGIYNVTLGVDTGSSLTSGNYNVLSGFAAGTAITSGGYNIFNGNRAGYNTTTGGHNIGGGFDALYNNTIGDNNVSLGIKTGYSTTTGSNNVFLGYYAGYGNTEGKDNVFIGYEAGYNFSAADYNIAIGHQAGKNGTTGNYSVFIGYRAGRDITTGVRNVFLGQQAGLNTETGGYNVFIGDRTGLTNSSGNYNTAINSRALYSLTSGVHNVAIGLDAGYDITTGDYNILLGRLAGADLTTGSYNVFVGYKSGEAATGQYNVALGFDTETAGYDNCFVVGRAATATANNQVRFGSSTAGLGTVTPETVTVDYTWVIYVNGTQFKIPMYRVP